MQELLDWLEYIEDDRQQRKIRHTLKDILVIVLFATLANADDWVEMALFAENYQDYLRKYIELKNGIPSHDTIRRVMGMISPEILQQLWNHYDFIAFFFNSFLSKTKTILFTPRGYNVSCLSSSPFIGTHGFSINTDDFFQQLTLYPRGVKRMVFVLDKKLLKKKAMKS